MKNTSKTTLKAYNPRYKFIRPFSGFSIRNRPQWYPAKGRQRLAQNIIYHIMVLQISSRTSKHVNFLKERKKTNTMEIEI